MKKILCALFVFIATLDCAAQVSKVKIALPPLNFQALP